MATEWLCVVVILVVAIYLKLTWSYNYWKKKGVKYIRPVPFFGNASTLFSKASPELFQDFYHSEELKDEKFGGIFLGSRPCLLVRDLELIKKILIKDFNYFSDRGIKYNKNLPLNEHLFNLTGWQWRALRIKLTPTFTSGKMRMMFNLMAECAESLERLLKLPAKEEKILEMREPLAQFATDVIGTCAFGLHLNTIENPNCEFRTMGRRMFEGSLWNWFKRALMILFPSVAQLLGISLLDRDMRKFFLTAFTDTVKHREESNKNRNDFMQLLIELKNKGIVHDTEGAVANVGKESAEDNQNVLEFTDNLLAAQAFLFFIAGFETSSTTMSFALYELALNPEVQKKLAQEITATLEANNGVLTYEVLAGMKYLDMVISETLRKYPPLGNLFRVVGKQYQIEDTNVILEPGMRVFIPVYAIQRDPKYFNDPQKFDPERFSSNEKEKRHAMTYLPFGDGPRNCIGARFGLLQTKLGLCALLKSYTFEVCAKTPIPAKLNPKGFVTSLRGGTLLRIKERRPLGAELQ